MKEQARSAVWLKGDVCWVQNSKQPSLLQHLEAELYLFSQERGRSWCCRLSGPLVSAGAGSQQRVCPGAGTARSGSALPRHRSPCTEQRGKQNLVFHCTDSGSPWKPKGELSRALDETFKAREGRIRCAAVHQSPSGPTFQRHVHLLVFKDSAENLVPYLGIDTETEHFRNLFLIVCIDFFWSLSLWAQLCCLNTDKTPIGTIIMAVSGENHYVFAGRAMKYFKINKPFTCMCFVKSCL